MSLTDLEYARKDIEKWKTKYLEARQETKKLADALEFIRDCEPDEEFGVAINARYLKEQARAILDEVQP